MIRNLPRHRALTFAALTAAFCLAAAGPAPAKNVDLSTVPERKSVQLTIYNSEDLTLVRETRRVSVKPGRNPLQFSWANTRIDPTSVQLRFLEHEEKLTLRQTTYPHDRPQVLYWELESEHDGEALVEISYFTSGIRWSADYVVIANAEESHARLESFVRVDNGSGERYEEAQVRLVVGRINLVQKIAELARIGVEKVETMPRDERRELRQRAARAMMEGDKQFAAAAEAAAPKEVEKEGLSEYFIYTSEGTETIPDGWAKRLRSFRAEAVPIRVVYRYRPREYGDRLVRLYLLRNDEASSLGTTPLPDGVVRSFRRHGGEAAGLSYLAEQSIRYVPIGDELELNLGSDPDVVFELTDRRAWRKNIWVQLRGGRVVRRVDDGRLDVDVRASVVGWDQHHRMEQRIHNTTGKPIDVEIRRTWSGDVTFVHEGLDAKSHDYRTVELTTSVDAGEDRRLPFELIHRHGRNKKQDRVTLERGALEAR